MVNLVSIDIKCEKGTKQFNLIYGYVGIFKKRSE